MRLDMLMSHLAIPVLKDTHSPVAFEAWKDSTIYPVDWYVHSPHKVFEHYVTFKMSDPQDDEVWLDVAGDQSPYSTYLNALGIEAWALDLSYPEGIDEKNRRIGADVSDIPLNPNSIDGMTLHCSFEHFEGSADINFIKEAARVLKYNGRCYILPFYTWDTYLEKAPQPSPNKGFARFYDEVAFEERLLPVLDPFNVTMYEVYLGEDYKFDLLLLEKI